MRPLPAVNFLVEARRSILAYTNLVFFRRLHEGEAFVNPISRRERASSEITIRLFASWIWLKFPRGNSVDTFLMLAILMGGGKALVFILHGGGGRSAGLRGRAARES